MKRILTIMLALLIVFCFTSCGNNEVDESEYVEELEEVEEEITYNENVEFENFGFEYTNAEGYKFKVNGRISPLILQSNTETICSAWNSVSDGEGELPTIDDWGLEEFEFDGKGIYIRNDAKSGPSFEAPSTNFDMYYAVGEISIENITNGFDIPKGYSETLRCNLEGTDYHSEHAPEGVNNSYNIGLGKIFYSNGSDIETFNGQVQVKPQFGDNNKWGAVPFILAYADSSTPNNPDGLFRNMIENDAAMRWSVTNSVDDLENVIGLDDDGIKKLEILD